MRLKRLGQRLALLIATAGAALGWAASANAVVLALA